MKSCVTVLLFNLIFFTSFAQTGTISGSVRFSDGKPVLHATVRINELKRLSVTNEKGFYEFKGIPYGTYEIEVSSIEIRKKMLRLELKEPHRNFHVTIDAKRDINLNEVVISKQSDKKEVETKGFAVNVIETERAALQSIQTNELLDRSAGVRIRQDGGLGSHIHYNINGLTGNAVRIFIDGVPVSNYGSSFSLNSLPPSLIERIEIYKGVVPAHLSEDALGGAINVVLKNRKRNSLTASYSYGSFNTHQWNASGSYRNDSTGFTVNASAFYNYSDNNYKVWGDDVTITNTDATITPIVARRFHDAYKSAGGRFDIGYTNVKWADNFSVGAIISGADKEVQHGTIMRVVYGNRTTDQQSAVTSLQYNKKDALFNGLDINVNGSYSFLNRGAVDTIGDKYSWNSTVIRTANGNVAQWASGAEQGVPSVSVNKEKNMVLRTNLDYAITDGNRIFVNVFYNNFERDNDNEMQPLAERQMINTRNLSKSVFGLTYENLAFNNKLRTNIFYKYFRQNHESIEPYWEGAQGTGTLRSATFERTADADGYGVALSYELFPKVFLMASGEKAVRMPEASELFGNDAENIVSSVNLEPERSHNANIGINLGPLKLGRSTLSLNSNFFLRETKDMIRLNEVDDLDQTNNYTNFNSIQSDGFDAELIYNYNRKLNVLFTVSKFNSKWNVQYDERGDPYLYYGSQLANEPNFKFNTTVSYYINDLFRKQSVASVNYNALYVNEFLRNFAGIGGRGLAYIPMQFVHDIGFTYTLPSRKITFGFDAKNIFNEQVFDNYALQKPGRAFYGKITYTLF